GEEQIILLASVSTADLARNKEIIVELYIQRSVDDETQELRATPTTQVFPGDMVVVRITPPSIGPAIAELQKQTAPPSRYQRRDFSVVRSYVKHYGPPPTVSQPSLVGRALAIALLGLAALPAGLTALLVWLAVGRPILFHQIRSGRYGRPF